MTKTAGEVFSKLLTPAQRVRAAKRAEEMAAEILTMQQLRKARHLTQVQLARTLGKQQVQISQLEKRTDMLLSTLRSYVEAMGGSLNLVVQFDGRNPVFLTGLGDEEPAAGPHPVPLSKPKHELLL